MAKKKKHTYSKVWGIAYAVHKPIRKVFQMSKKHKQKARGPYLLGSLNVSKYTIDDLNNYLTGLGFEKSHLAWKEPGEMLSVRKVDGSKYQWHIRLFEDGEVRGHYETSPEANPIKHIKEAFNEFKLQDDKTFLLSLLDDYVLPLA